MIQLSRGKVALDIDVSFTSLRVCPVRLLRLRYLEASLAAIPNALPPIFAGIFHAKLPLRSDGGRFARVKTWGSCAMVVVYPCADGGQSEIR